MNALTIQTKQHYSDAWTATEGEWDLGDPVGYGQTEESAVQDLRDKIEDREQRFRQSYPHLEGVQ